MMKIYIDLSLYYIYGIYYMYYIYLTDFLQLQICFTPLLPPYSDSDEMANPEIINFVVKPTSDTVTMSIFVGSVSAPHHQW
jgi:hypothetical protein